MHTVIIFLARSMPRALRANVYMRRHTHTEQICSIAHVVAWHDSNLSTTGMISVKGLPNHAIVGACNIVRLPEV